MKRLRICLLVLITGLGIAADGSASAAQASARIVAQYPHDPAAFTQGLLIDNGTLFESTGQYGHSSLRRVDLETGQVQQSVRLPDYYFGEGLALADGKLYQLTWKAGRVFVYDRDSLKRVGQFSYSDEGWGLTWDGKHLIMSDGSAVLRVIDPQDFSIASTIAVSENGKPLKQLNELEYIDGKIWANVWFDNRIVRIDPASGHVTGAVNASALRAALPDNSNPNVLNGIAWDAEHRRLYLTGKYWPRLFQIAWPPRGCRTQGQSTPPVG